MDAHAGTILLPVAKLILGKAADLALQQIGLLWNFRSELKKFEDTVSRIQAVLRDAEEKQFHSHQVKDWLEKLSDVMYDADDLLDDLATEARTKALLATATDDDGGRRTTTTTNCWSLVCFLFSSLSKQLAYDLEMARAIKAIREKLDEISKDKDDLHLEVHSIGDEALPSRETDSCPPTIVVGREDDKNKIIQLLLNSNQEANISVVAIVGLGGLGKTTLAQLIFDDRQVKNHFNIKAWIYVSQSFDIKMILEKMLRSIDRECQAGPELNNLQTQLREKIEGKRFLFVLDDVWEETGRSWETLGKYLMLGALGSKVLVTTRSTRVAEVGGGALKSRTSTNIMESYQLKGLSKEESWKLLVEKFLPENVPQDPQVQETGMKILRKCDGVPLAVSTIAGVLVDSTNPHTEWQSFLDKSISSIGKQGEEDPIMSTLRLSFNHLPSYMKHCFTYCKVFSKGSRIDIKQLVRFWVAQGYVESEDKGLTCFQTLLWRSFYQEVEMDGLGNMSTCRMHDLMHDLVDTIAGEKIIRSSSSTILQNIPSKTRHLMIGNDNSDNPRDGDLRNASQVRSLYLSHSRKEFKQVLKNFLRLRSLVINEKDSILCNEEDSILDASIDKLKHLRYFGLHCNRMEKIPDSVTNVINMQVLHLFGTKYLKELPKDIKKLINLKHLEVDPNDILYLTHMPKGIGELQFLQTLPVFVVGKKSGSNNDEMVGAALDELKGLNALCGELTIKGLANADSPEVVYILKEKPHLQSLILDWGRHVGNDDVTLLSTHDEGILEMLSPHPNLKNFMIHSGYEGVKLPNWLSGLTNLVEFSLNDCKRCEYLPSQMHEMLSLKKLTIMNCPILKGIINNNGSHCDSSPDNSITKRLTTKEEDDKWPRFHRLSYLRTRNCPRLTRLPLFPTVEGKLVLERVSLAPFARTMKMKKRSGGVGGVDYSDDANIHASSSSAFVHPPLSKLTKLTLEDIYEDLESLSYRDSSSCLVSLQKLTVWGCNRGVKLPGSLCSSIYLTKILIIDCGAVEYLPPLHELPSLNKLYIMDCPELKGCWWKKTKKKKKKQGNSNSNADDDDDYYNFDPNSMEGDEQKKEDEETEEEEWPHFPRLSYLEIKSCPKLTRMPLFPTVEGELMFYGTSPEAVVRTMKMKVVAAPNYNHNHNLHSQQHSTTTAATTAIATTRASPSSSSSSSSLFLRTSLVTPPLSKLSTLILGDMDDLESLLEQVLCNLTSLRKLEIWDCPRLASLPPAMQHLTFLQKLKIYRCHGLASLPPAMRHLTSLQKLYIWECPLLRERCRKGEGEDWPNISHIPRIYMDGVCLQKESELAETEDSWSDERY